MRLIIRDLLAPEQLARAIAVFEKVALVDGKETTGEAAKLVKRNKQAFPATDDQHIELMICKRAIADALVNNNEFQAWARPKAIIEIVFAEYGQDDEYGWHVDNPLMNALRTDLAFTLWLSSPNYEGGEHEIYGEPGKFRLLPNTCMVYPANTRHRVTPIKHGIRRVAVGWIQSYIRDHAQRELLFDLDNARSRLFDQHGKTEEHDLLTKAEMNLVRMWSE
jgi:PKHD-type hydroxylase